MREQSTQTREQMGCGYLPLTDAAFPWSPAGRVECADERDLSTGKLHLPVCPGYVCSLPEVIEVSQAHLLMKSGGLLQFTQGEPPSEALLSAVMTIEGESGKLIGHLRRQSEPKR